MPPTRASADQQTAVAAIDPHSPLSPIERELRQRFQTVDFIGELNIEREQFDIWCQMVQREAIRRDRFQPKLIPPALFVTLMVFTARYSEVEARNFWDPYAQMVWGKREASQSLQGSCRERFKASIDFLVAEYGLTFPQHSSGDVVRPVYRHAVIPAYLEATFMEWLGSRWQEVLEVPADFLVTHLQQEHSLRYLPRTLHRFLTERDTADTAADLIRALASAVSLYHEGESLADISELLADAPIEQALWNELALVITAQDQQRERRRRAHVEWVWSLDETELLLRIRSVTLSSESRPDLAVWTARDTPPEELAEAELYLRLDPWQMGESEWLVDELFFPSEGPLDGKLALLGADDAVLWEQSVPNLPVEPVQFFRFTQQGAYALPIEANAVQSGRYLMAGPEGIVAVDESGQKLPAESAVILPYLLKKHFASAMILNIDRPVQVKQRGELLATIAVSGSGLPARLPYIAGDAPIPGLSPRVPPAFSSADVWLTIPGSTKRFLERTSLWLRSQRGEFQRRMLNELDVTVDREGGYAARLGSLLADRGGYYLVELRQGLHPLTPAPLEFTVLPGVEVIPPTGQPIDGRIYTPLYAPHARMRGVQLDQIGNPAQVEVAPDAEWLVIAWPDLRSGCRLLLRVNRQLIPLEWPVKRFAAWIEPETGRGVYTLDEVERAMLRAVGSRDLVQYFFLGMAGDQNRLQVRLDAQGKFSAPIRQHPLFDLLRHSLGGRVQVNVSLFDSVWPLLTMERPAEGPAAGTIQRIDTGAAGMIEVGAPAVDLTELFVAREDQKLELTPELLWRLATLPPSAIDEHTAGQLGQLWPPLAAIREVHDVSGWKERYGLLPAWVVASRPLRVGFDKDTALVFPETALHRGRWGVGFTDLNFIHGRSRAYVSWNPTRAGEHVVQVRIGMPPIVGRYSDADELDLETVYRCATCGRFFSRGQWKRHTHAGEKYPNAIDLLNQMDTRPFLARLAPGVTNVALPFLDKPSAVLDLKIMAQAPDTLTTIDATAHRPSDPVSSSAHYYACALWLERSQEDTPRRRIADMLSDSAWQRSAAKLEGLIGRNSIRTLPAYAALGRLLDAFGARERRKPLQLLDRDLLLLAMLARNAAHDPALYSEVKRSLHIDESTLARMLHRAHLYAPELLQWALTWTELFCVHTLT